MKQHTTKYEDVYVFALKRNRDGTTMWTATEKNELKKEQRYKKKYIENIYLKGECGKCIEHHVSYTFFSVYSFLSSLFPFFFAGLFFIMH